MFFEHGLLNLFAFMCLILYGSILGFDFTTSCVCVCFLVFFDDFISFIYVDIICDLCFLGYLLGLFCL